MIISSLLTAYSLYNDGFYRPVPGGVMVFTGEYFGTSSYVVEDQATGERFLLIVYHLPKHAGIYEIYQPNTSSGYYYIGDVVNYNEYVDAAIVRANEEPGVEFDPRIRLSDWKLRHTNRHSHMERIVYPCLT